MSVLRTNVGDIPFVSYSRNDPGYALEISAVFNNAHIPSRGYYLRDNTMLSPDWEKQLLGVLTVTQAIRAKTIWAGEDSDYAVSNWTVQDEQFNHHLNPVGVQNIWREVK